MLSLVFVTLPSVKEKPQTFIMIVSKGPFHTSPMLSTPFSAFQSCQHACLLRPLLLAISVLQDCFTWTAGKKLFDLSREGRAFRSWGLSEPWQHSRHPPWAHTHWIHTPSPSCAASSTKHCHLRECHTPGPGVCWNGPKLLQLLCTEFKDPLFSYMRNVSKVFCLLAIFYIIIPYSCLPTTVFALFSWDSVPFHWLILSFLQVIKVCSVTILMFSNILSYTLIYSAVLSGSISRGSALGVKLLILIIFTPNSRHLCKERAFWASENDAVVKIVFCIMWTQWWDQLEGKGRHVERF